MCGGSVEVMGVANLERRRYRERVGAVWVGNEWLTMRSPYVRSPRLPFNLLLRGVCRGEVWGLGVREEGGREDDNK